MKTFRSATTKLKPPRKLVVPAAGLPPSKTLETTDDIRAGIKALRHKCDAISRIHDLAGDPPLRRRAGGFEGLARIIVGQQVSVASANAIWGRLALAAVPMAAATIVASSDDLLRGAGLSRPKMTTLRAVAEALEQGFDLEGLSALPVDDARAALMAIKGIGPWSADVYLMFCVGHVDVFASGDLALQVAAEWALDLPARPDARQLAAIAADRWQPWRGVAARMLWHYYAVRKTASTGAPV